jgi:diguanylate cyclase (GGDEF)-like protein/PAS domain S-box-containing protein
MGRRRPSDSAGSGRGDAFRLLAEQSGDMVCQLSLMGQCRYVSPAATRILGLPPAALLERDLAAVVAPEDRPALHQALDRLRRGEVAHGCIGLRARHAAGRPLWLEVSLGLLHAPRSGKALGMVATVRDITDRKAAEAELQALALSDDLTGLPNRRRLEAALEVAWRRCRDSAEPLSVLLLDVDRFKVFNDSFGHLAGDACLRGVAVTLGASIRRERDLAGRYGGEEFLVLLPATAAPEAEAIGERLRAAVERLGIAHAARAGHNACITVSVGVATAQPQHETPPGIAALLAEADRALYAAKRGGRNRVAVAGLLPRALPESLSLLA